MSSTAPASSSAANRKRPAPAAAAAASHGHASVASYFVKAPAPAKPAAAAGAGSASRQRDDSSSSSPSKRARVDRDDPFALQLTDDEQEDEEPPPRPKPASLLSARSPMKAVAAAAPAARLSKTAVSPAVAASKPISAAAPAASSRNAGVQRMNISDDDESVDLTAARPAPAAKAGATAATPARASSSSSAAAAARPTAHIAAAASPVKPAAKPISAKPAAAVSVKKEPAATSVKKEPVAAAAAAPAEREKPKPERKAPSAGAPAAAAAAAAAPSPRRPAASKKGKKGKRYDGSDLAAKVSTDVSVVLGGVQRLQDELSAAAAENRPTLRLSDLHLPHVRTDVLSLSDDEVRAQIERVAVRCMHHILAGQGFSYAVPMRNSGNQHYVPELDRIVLGDKSIIREFSTIKHARKTALTTRVLGLIYELCIKKIHVTKRDLFYTDVKLFTKQADSDEIIEDVAAMLGSTRSSLNVVASEKGVVVGQISFRDDGDFIDCTKMGVGGKAIPPTIDRVTEISGSARFVLLVEKDAAFMRLAEDRFYLKYPCAIMTAKGQPDVATRVFLKKVKETLNIPVLGLVDSDPYGLKILSVYMSGSKNMSYDSASLTTPDIKWLGVRPSDLDRYNIPEQCRLPMTDHDIKTGRELLQEEFIQKNPEWMAELQLMVKNKEKAEIQSLSAFGFKYLSEVFLPLKLQEQDWI